MVLSVVAVVWTPLASRGETTVYLDCVELIALYLCAPQVFFSCFVSLLLLLVLLTGASFVTGDLPVSNEQSVALL